MEATTDTCNDDGKCEDHYHVANSVFETEKPSQVPLVEQHSSGSSSNNPTSEAHGKHAVERERNAATAYGADDRGFRCIIRNFTPSYASS